jgi:hypothetical protein
MGRKNITHPLCIYFMHMEQILIKKQRNHHLIQNLYPQIGNNTPVCTNDKTFIPATGRPLSECARTMTGD